MARIIFTCGLILSLGVLAFAQDAAPPKGKVKAQTQIVAKITKTIDATSSNVGEDVNFVLTDAVEGEGMKIEPGSELYARIVNVETVSDNNKESLISIMFDFVQSGEDFMPCKAVIVGIEQMGEDIKFESSETFEGGTVLRLRGKNLKIDEGKIFKVKLIKDVAQDQ